MNEDDCQKPGSNNHVSSSFDWVKYVGFSVTAPSITKCAVRLVLFLFFPTDTC